MIQFGLGQPLTPVIKNLLIANIIVFLAQLLFEAQGNSLEPLFALWPFHSELFKVWQLVTHLFMHGGFFHLFFNMYALIMFGTTLEKSWGSKRFFQFYIICGIMAGATHLFFTSNGYAVGASGAIMGVLAAFAYLFGETPLMVFPLPVEIKAKWLIPGFILIDVFSAIAPQTDDNIAHWAHIGGALTGLIIVIFWNKTNRKTFY